jgi:hypothetical protein
LSSLDVVTFSSPPPHSLDSAAVLVLVFSF